MLSATLALGGCFDFDALRGLPADLSGVADGSDNTDGGAADLGIYAFEWSWPTHKSLYYGSHDPAPATLTFTYAADSVLCSHDGGNTWATCDTPHTLVFTPDDYNQGRTLAIKLTKAGQPDGMYTFNLPTELPGLHFYNCDQVVTADESAQSFYARLAANRVICLAAGVTITYMQFDAGISNSTTGIFLDATNGNNLKIIGTEANRPLFANGGIGGNQGGFVSMSSALTGVVLSNLQVHVVDGNPISFEMNGGNNAFSYIDALVSAGGNDVAVAVGGGMNNSFYDVDVDARMSPGTIVFHVSGTASASVTGGKIQGRDDTANVLLEGGAVSFTGVTVETLFNTTQTPKVAAFQLITGTLTMNTGSVSASNDAVVIGGGGTAVSAGITQTTVTGGTGVKVGYQSSLTLSGATVKTNGIGVIVDGGNLHVDGSLFERLDLAGAAGPAIDARNQVLISSTTNGNHFCDQNLAGTNKFSGSLTIEAGASNLGNYDPAKQVNMSVIDQCP